MNRNKIKGILVSKDLVKMGNRAVKVNARIKDNSGLSKKIM